MALSMDEQRILSEIATRLRDNDPGLAQRLSTFGRARRRRRIKLLIMLPLAMTLATVITVAVVIAAS
ncbi:MAG TPA: DUF3040 domain-containing protein [Actinomadura sp.]|jgi:type VI protein secretion system component VasF|nr:DUF3040 domain-containing protein [Actinomadura sp.]